MSAGETARGCRHCDSRAVAKVALTKGCVVFPDDREQWLCAQHFDRLTPLQDEPVEVLRMLWNPWVSE